MNRKASRHSRLGASAQPIFEMMKMRRVTLIMGFLPNISDNGAIKRGPQAKPNRNHDIPEVAARSEQW